MILKSITVIEHDDRFFGDAIFNNEPDLAMLRYMKETKIVSHENLDHDTKMPVTKSVFCKFNLIDIFRHNTYNFIVWCLQGYAFILLLRVLLLIWN